MSGLPVNHPEHYFRYADISGLIGFSTSELAIMHQLSNWNRPAR